MLIKIAWRNIWRNKLRSLVLITAISLGLWGSIFTLALMFGMVEQRFNDCISTEISHIQIHHPDFKTNKEAKYAIPNPQKLLQAIQQNPKVKIAVGRSITMGMASSATAGTGVIINGITPEQEQKITNVFQKITDGAYFEGIKKNPIVIGEKLAHKLKVKVRSKIVLTFQNKDGIITAGAFRIAGLYKTSNSRFDEAQVFVNINDLAELLGTDGQIQEIAMLLINPDDVRSYASDLRDGNPGLVIETWEQLDPTLSMMTSMMDVTLYIFMSVILMAILFGIVNTMLMAILERYRELGMLMAIGMNKMRIFIMIVMETVFLAITGGIIGMIIGWTTIQYIAIDGINLSFIAEGLADFGVSEILYPYLALRYYPILTLMIFFTAIISAIYPAVKALKLKPAIAIRII